MLLNNRTQSYGPEETLMQAQKAQGPEYLCLQFDSTTVHLFSHPTCYSRMCCLTWRSYEWALAAHLPKGMVNCVQGMCDPLYGTHENGPKNSKTTCHLNWILSGFTDHSHIQCQAHTSLSSCTEIVTCIFTAIFHHTHCVIDGSFLGLILFYHFFSTPVLATTLVGQSK